jgi:hypothetical protein
VNAGRGSASVGGTTQEGDNTVALLRIEREVGVARKACVAAMRHDDLVEHAKGAVGAVRRSRAIAPKPRRQEDVAFDKTLRLQLVAKRVDRLVDDEMGACPGRRRRRA